MREKSSNTHPLKGITAGRKSETRVAKELGARVVPNSGAVHGLKSDCYTADFRFESKATETATMKLAHDWLQKISHEALSTGKMPALTVSFVNGDGRPKKDGDWVLLRLRDFHELTSKE